MPDRGRHGRRRGQAIQPIPADSSTPAVVLKLNPGHLHHGGLGAIRTLGRAGVPVYVVPSIRLDPTAHSRYLSGGLSWQPDPEQVERTQAGLRLLAGRIGRPAVLIPTDEASAIFLAEHGGPLRDCFLFPEPPAGLPRRLADKSSLYRICQELGMPTPRTSVPACPGEAHEFAARVGYPLIAKLPTAWNTVVSGLRGTTVITSEQQLASLLATCARTATALLLQERIPGGGGSEWFFHGYCDAASACRPGFTGVKDRAYPVHGGFTSLGRTVGNDALRNQVAPLLTRLSYRGLLDMDFRRDPSSGAYLLLDFNPRLGAPSRVSRDRSGLGVVLASYLDLTGQEVTVGEQDSGRSLLVEDLDLRRALRQWRRGDLGLWAWLRSLHDADETAWFARDDLRPFGLMCARLASDILRPPLRRHHSQAAPRDSRPRYRPGRAQTKLPGPGHQTRRAGSRHSRPGWVTPPAAGHAAAAPTMVPSGYGPEPRGTPPVSPQNAPVHVAAVSDGPPVPAAVPMTSNQGHRPRTPDVGPH